MGNDATSDALSERGPKRPDALKCEQVRLAVEPRDEGMQAPQETGTDGFLIRQERPAPKYHSSALPKRTERPKPTEAQKRSNPHREPGNLLVLGMRRDNGPLHIWKAPKEIVLEGFIPKIPYAVVTDQQKTHLHTIATKCAVVLLGLWRLRLQLDTLGCLCLCNDFFLWCLRCNSQCELVIRRETLA